MHHTHLKPGICVSGSTDAPAHGKAALDAAKQIGSAIARAGMILLIPTHAGFPLWAAIGAKEAGGIVVGISPAPNEKQHTHHHRLPLDYMDTVLYAGSDDGFEYVLLAHSAHGMIGGGGRLADVPGLKEVYAKGVPAGIIDGLWDTETLRADMEAEGMDAEQVYFDTDAERLVRTVREGVG